MAQNPGHKGSNQGGSGASRMTQSDAARIQSAADRNPNSSTSQSGFKERAQSTADRNANSGGGRK
ncbi:hypothetical protein B0O80DRAFT_452059 [Mortierella sp. GBAus27b]|nr:hypothetical protein B0O80DRAFT_452059 [Mortierella sp. GBAus27b]